jgi:hypothetical protein
MNGNDKELSKTLETMTGIRFHIQSGNGDTGTIMVERMYFTGDVSKFYKYGEPPEYKEPTDPIPPPPTHTIRVAQHTAYSIKKSIGMVHITLQPNMAGASAMVMDARGRVVKRVNVPQNAQLDIVTRDLAAGIYFVEIKGNGVPRLLFTISPVW